LLPKARSYSSKAKAGHTFHATTGACARPRAWTGACDWTGTIYVSQLSIAKRNTWSKERFIKIKKKGQKRVKKRGKFLKFWIVRKGCQMLRAEGAGRHCGRMESSESF
jgi:hypothetical protein